MIVLTWCYRSNKIRMLLVVYKEAVIVILRIKANPTKDRYL